MKDVLIEIGKKPIVSEVIKIYAAVGWGSIKDYEPDKYQIVFNNSHFITATLNGNLIGLIRFISDEYHATTVNEFAVLPDFQKQGIGASMLESLITHFGHTDIYINTPDDFIDFFTSNGMKLQTHLKQVSRRSA